MRSWPHAPSKVVNHPGTYIVTGGTYRKERFFCDDAKLEVLHDALLHIAEGEGWDLMAWAVFANHYHFVGVSPEVENSVSILCSKLHSVSARALNLIDHAPGRRVWYQYFDTRLTYEKSLLARIAYVHSNPVKHGIVGQAEMYPWCSAAWFMREGDKPFVQSVLSFKTDKVNVYDEY